MGTIEQIMKINEQRRSVLYELNQFDSIETALLIDRYKYLDLLPCTQSEIKSITHKEMNGTSSHGMLTMSNMSNKMQIDEPNTSACSDTSQKSKYPQPDPTAMRAYKHVHNQNARSGSYYSLPTNALELLKRLPPPYCFEVCQVLFILPIFSIQCSLISRVPML